MKPWSTLSKKPFILKDHCYNLNLIKSVFTIAADVLFWWFNRIIHSRKHVLKHTIIGIWCHDTGNKCSRQVHPNRMLSITLQLCSSSRNPRCTYPEQPLWTSERGPAASVGVKNTTMLRFKQPKQLHIVLIHSVILYKGSQNSKVVSSEKS